MFEKSLMILVISYENRPQQIIKYEKRQENGIKTPAMNKTTSNKAKFIRRRNQDPINIENQNKKNDESKHIVKS